MPTPPPPNWSAPKPGGEAAEEPPKILADEVLKIVEEKKVAMLKRSIGHCRHAPELAALACRIETRETAAANRGWSR
jgi:hypothetical protein